MRRALIVLFIVLFTGASLAYLGGFRLPHLDVPSTTHRAAAPAGSKLVGDIAAALGAGQAAPAADEPRFDVARLDPEGTSVFAGQAPPDSDVTILADGAPIGTAKADSNGEWTLFAERAVKTSDAKLAVRLGRTEPVAPADFAGADAKPGVATQGPRREERTVASRLVDDLEKLVEKAREEEAARKAPERGPPVANAAVVPSEPTRPARPAPELRDVKPLVQPETRSSAQGVAAPKQPDVHVAAVGPRAVPVGRGTATDAAPVSIPIPITFLYNETEFTTDGLRAATLLLEYVRLKRFQSVSLTGHADERGSTPFNVELSRERLDAVAKFLRSGGFTGKFDLVAKGESEPFSRIDRRTIGVDDLYQLDRRVELRLTN